MQKPKISYKTAKKNKKLHEYLDCFMQGDKDVKGSKTHNSRRT